MSESNTKSDLTPRSAQEAARRVLALLTVIGKVHDPERCVAWMRNHNLERYLSPAEIAFVEQEVLPEDLRVAFSWRAEAMVSLLWALGGLPKMPPFDEQFEVFGVQMVKAALEDPAAFVDQARLRSAEEISQMENNLYHQHWRVRDRELGLNVGKHLEPDPGDPPIEELNHGIVHERRYGLSWLAGWGEDWDHVPTHT
jgi:hypothetical protein